MTFAVSPTIGRALDALALLAVLLAAVAMALGLPPKPLPTDSFLMVDYGLNTRQAVTIQQLAAAGGSVTWPEHYAYPPAYVVLMLGWLKLGALAFPAWIALGIAALLAIVVVGAKDTGLARRPGGIAVAALAVLVVSYAVGWDLKSRNVNLAYLLAILLALWLGARRPALAGLLLSLSVAIKLYSVLFLPWLVWKRRWAWLCWTLAGIGLWFAALPMLVFGPAETILLTKAWWVALGPAGEPAYQAMFPGYLISLHKTLAGLLSLPPTDAQVVYATRALQIAWLALIAWMLWRWPPDDLSSGALLVLAPLPLGPVLQPHHAAVMLLPALVLLAIAADDAASRAKRAASAAVLLLCFVLTQSGPAGTWRGVSILLATLILAVSVGALSRAGAVGLLQRVKRL
ncbi:MAG: DUF2029 domain-containing protein [Rhodospirillales bacterium]|nr:DUF2029 domain-containing protein [Rhodospirillales bacterium]